ncbi:hypothetical protein COTS27_00494 [Spirochaetota bacterium]|nr:hypothetical protein COTS27_00494 [Spirochaetota bacterium]
MKKLWSKTIFPWLAIPIVGSLLFLLKKKRKKEAVYALFVMNLALYGYAMFSMILGYTVLEVFPYFLESYVYVCLKINAVFITLGFLLLAMSEIFKFEMKLLGYFPILSVCCDYLMENR